MPKSLKKNKIHLKKILKYYWIHIKKYKKFAIGVQVFFILASISSTLATPIFYKQIIDLISNTTNRASISHELMYLLGLIFLNSIFFNIFYRLGDYTYTYFVSNVAKELSFFTFNSLQKHSFSFFSDNFSGALVTKSKRFIYSFYNLTEQFVFSISFRLIRISIYIITLAVFAPILAIIYVIWLFIYCTIVYSFTKKQAPLDLAEASADSKVTSRLADNITNILNIKIFASQKLESERFLKVLNTEEKKRRTSLYFKNFQNVLQGLLFMILEISIMYIALNKWIDGEITAGSIAIVQLYIIGSFDVVWGIGRSIISIQKSLTDAQEMIDIFETESDIKDTKNPEKCKINKGEIKFENVTFKYKQNKNVFDNFNFKIQSNQKIGLVGHSGAGKSTIINLLLRFVDVNSGCIKIDNQDIRKISQDDLRKNISYVPQESILFHRSIYENIAYGKPNAKKDEVIEAAKKAHAHEFIVKLPNGYNTLVGERGTKLSGGERQRVAIARAMLKNAPILVLDEATSALDSISEKYIQEAFETLMKNRTTIVIAHRLSTIQRMDRIIVLDDGRIVEEGTHEKLIGKNSGIYSEFWKSQSSEFLRD